MNNSVSFNPILTRFERAMNSETSVHDMGYLSLLMASCHFQQLEVDAYLSQLDLLAARAKDRLGRARTPSRVLDAINHVLYEEEGFHGNTRDYYDPRNSFLNSVLDRRTGIPISLSAIYLAVARRLRQPIFGVGMPLHFIVKYVGRGEEIFIDPFNRGKILTVEDCQNQVERAFGAPINFHATYLDAVTPRMMLYRMLNNLKQIYVRQQDLLSAGLVVEQMLIVRPDLAESVRDRGLLYLQERRWSLAVAWLSRYLRENPDAEDSAFVRRQLERAQNHRAWMN